MKIFLDVDGVLADFVSAACRLHERDPSTVVSWNFYEGWGLTAKEFWSPIHDLGASFYRRHVKPFPWAGDLLHTIMDYDANFVLCTACGGGTPEDVAGKMEWIKRFIGNVPVILVAQPIEGEQQCMKSLLAQRSMTNRVLIDDCDKNVESFEDWGGQGITFPRPWNGMRTFSADPVEHVRCCLADIKQYGFPITERSRESLV